MVTAGSGKDFVFFCSGPVDELIFLSHLLVLPV